MYFNGRGYLRLSVGTSINLPTQRVIFEPMYLSKDGQNIGFRSSKNNSCIFTFYGTQNGICLKSGEFGWVKALKFADHAFKFSMTPELSQAAHFMMCPIGSSVMLWLAQDTNCLVGMDLNGDPHRPYLLAYTLTTAVCDIEYILPPLEKFNPNQKDKNYSQLPFVDDTIGAFNLTDINFNECDFTNTTFSGTTLTNAQFNKTKLIKCKSNPVGGTNSFKSAAFNDAKLIGADFSQHCDFSHAQFAKADLTDSDFRNSMLCSTKLNGAILENTDFRGADLSQADLSSVDMSKIKIDHKTKLNHATINNSDVSGIDFSGIDLTGVNFSGSTFNKTILKGCILKGTKFIETNLCNSIFDEEPLFSRTSTNRTSFESAKLDFSTIKRKWSYLDLSNSTIENLPDNLSDKDIELHAENALLVGLHLTGKKLLYAHFNNSDMRSAHLDKTDLSHASLKGVRLGGDSAELGACLIQAKLFNTDLSSSILSGADFTKAMFFGEASTVSDATLPCTKFTNAFLAGMDFSNVKDMRGVNFDYACLINCKLMNCNMTSYENLVKSSLIQAYIQGADFSDGKLNTANMMNAYVSEEPGQILVHLPDYPDLQWQYEKTKIDKNCTGDKTICPNSTYGPCSVEQFRTKDHPTEWPLHKEDPNATQQFMRLEGAHPVDKLLLEIGGQYA